MAHWLQVAVLCVMGMLVWGVTVKLIVSVIRTRSPLDEIELDERVWELEED